MGRRFAIGTDAALTGVLVSSAICVWTFRRDVLDFTTLAVGVAGPSAAGIGLVLLLVAIPPLAPSDTLARPLTYTLPAVHVALTLFVTKAMLTGSNPVSSVHEKLLPATLWFQPLALLTLFGLSWMILEINHRRNRAPVS